VKKRREDEEKRILLERRLESLIPESKLYNNMVEFEKKIDAHLAKRQLEYHETIKLHPTSRLTGALQIKISNTQSNQRASYHIDSSFQSTLSEPSSWTLKIEGKLVAPSIPPATAKLKFCNFFKRIFIQLDKQQYPNQDIIEWHKLPTNDGFDGFEVKRPGNIDTPAKILLYIDHKPPIFKLSTKLSAALNVVAETRSKIITLLWQYIRHNKLQDPDDRKTIISNTILREIFGLDKMTFNQIPQLINEHLNDPDPIEIDFMIRVSDTEEIKNELVRNIPIQIDEPKAASKQMEFNNAEIDTIESQIIDLVEKVNQHKRKRDFMLNFSRSPVEFIDFLISSQLRDVQLMHTEGPTEEEIRHSSYYYQPFVEEAVQNIFQNQLVTQER